MPPGERFTVVRLSEGYDIAEVDAFVDRIRATLGTTLSDDEVRQVQFTAVRLRAGYDMRSVDEYLDDVIARLSVAPTPPAVAEPPSSSPPSAAERAALLAVAGRERGSRFARPRFGRGYHPDQVDAFVDEVRGTLATTLTRAEVANTHFDLVWRGYDPREVDAWLVAVEDHTRG
nr:DivIVA domain-containing protein [Jiangella mangrovi]